VAHFLCALIRVHLDCILDGFVTHRSFLLCKKILLCDFVQEKDSRLRRSSQREEEISDTTPKAVDAQPVASFLTDISRLNDISRLEIADKVTHSAIAGDVDNAPRILGSSGCVVSSVASGYVNKSAEFTDDCLISLHSDNGIDGSVIQDGDESSSCISHDQIAQNFSVSSNQTSNSAATEDNSAACKLQLT